MAVTYEPSAEPLFKNCPDCGGNVAPDFGCENPSCDQFAKEGPYKGVSNAPKNQTIRVDDPGVLPSGTLQPTRPIGYLLCKFRAETGEFHSIYTSYVYPDLDSGKSEMDYANRHRSKPPKYVFKLVAVYSGNVVE